MGKSFCKIENKWCKFCKHDSCFFSTEGKQELAIVHRCPKREAKLTIRLKDLIEKAEFENVWTELIANYHDQDSNKSGYEKVFNMLREKKANKTDWFILLKKCHEDARPELDIEECDYFDVCGIAPNGRVYAIDLEEWHEWLGMNISQESLDNFSTNTIIAACLYEMTYHGFDENDPTEFAQDLSEQIEKIVNKNKSKKAS